jgi:hypothetical protein
MACSGGDGGDSGAQGPAGGGGSATGPDGAGAEGPEGGASGSSDAAWPPADAFGEAGGEGAPSDEIRLDWKSLPPVGPKREARHNWTVVWLRGTPVEMGRQHGQLLHDELSWALSSSSYVKNIVLMLPAAKALGLDKLARNNSYPQIVSECEGMVQTAGDVGWTMDLCLLVSFGDVIIEATSTTGPGCSQFVVGNSATPDGRVLHGRLLDWTQVDLLLRYPVVFVRQPDGEIPHAVVGFPGNLSPYSGMNAEGLSIGSNEVQPASAAEKAKQGHSHVQMLGRLLASASTLDQALATIQGEKHMSAEAFGIAYGPGRDGAAVEMTAAHLGVRRMADGNVFLTNHFVAQETQNADGPSSSSSTLRFERLAQLLTPSVPGSRHGAVDRDEAVRIVRDRVNPSTKQESPAGTFDDNGSLATNGALYAMVFEPGALRIWVAAGAVPVPEQPFVGFSLAELLGAKSYPAVTPEVIK